MDRSIHSNDDDDNDDDIKTINIITIVGRP